MIESRYDAAISRRSLLGRIAAIGASYVGLSAFGRFIPERPSGPAWDDAFELAVDFEIAQPNEGRSHRPYVAVWLEDASGAAVRTLVLWVNTTGRGPRYIRELKRWFGASETERTQGGPDLVATVSSATRLPGKYNVTWNGRDDRGRAVEQGTYRLMIEAAREHGPYEVIQQELALATTPKSMDLQGNGEIVGGRVELRRRK